MFSFSGYEIYNVEGSAEPTNLDNSELTSGNPGLLYTIDVT